MEMVALITAAAKAAAVPPALLLSICYTESTFRNVIHPDDGRTASLGICQVKTSTARMFEKGATDAQLMVPKYNARIAALYLSRQLKRYHGSWVCAATAYNRGSVPQALLLDTNVAKCQSQYSQKVMKHFRETSWKKNKAQGRANRSSSSTKRH